jgi:PAS domain S-box-containing protein
MIDFFEFSNEMLCLADRRGYFVRVNEAWTRTLGWTAAELTSRPYLDFVHPDDRESTIREAKLLESDSHETIRFENRYRCADGSYRWLSWQVAPKKESGQLLAAARDVTEQKRQQEELRRHDERFRTLAAQAPVGIAEADVNASITYVNRKWCELAGVKPEEALGFAWKRFIHPDDLPSEIERLQHALRSGEDVAPHEFRFVHTNGDIRWGLSSVSLVKNSAGQIVGQIATIEDITERKRAELTLREKQALLRSLIAVQEQEKQRISYEFHDGLIQDATAALLFLEGRKYRYPADEEGLIDKAIRSLRTGIHGGRLIVRRIRPTVLDEYGIRAAIDDLIDQLSDSKIAIQWRGDPQIGRLPQAVEATIYRVVQEGLLNACHHSKSERIELSLHKADDAIGFDVRDFGVGFDVEAEENRNSFGLLGMAERVRLLDGEWTIESKPGCGTRVAARIPLNTADDE